jgi:hypothetical protein
VTEHLVERFGPEPVKQAVEKAFGNEPSKAADYLTSLRTIMKDITDAQRRSVVLLLLVATAFVMLDHSAIVNAQLGPFQIRDLSPVQKALPVLFAYLIYDSVVSGVRYLYSRVVYYEISHLCQEHLHSTHLDRLVLPHGSSLFGPWLFLPEGNRLQGFIRRTTRVLRWGALASVFAVEVYLIYRLFRVYGAGDIVVWLSAIISLSLVVFSVMVGLVSRPNQLTRPLRGHSTARRPTG